MPPSIAVSTTRGAITDRTFEIEFLDPGVSVYAFTFG
jgi:Thioredoxin like C-terminal domain